MGYDCGMSRSWKFRSCFLILFVAATVAWFISQLAPYNMAYDPGPLPQFSIQGGLIRIAWQAKGVEAHMGKSLDGALGPHVTTSWFGRDHLIDARVFVWGEGYFDRPPILIEYHFVEISLWFPWALASSALVAAWWKTRQTKVRGFPVEIRAPDETNNPASQ